MTLAYLGMVAAPHALASEAGVEALKAGGSAVDAAIAANAVLNAVYSHMSGIGGDAFCRIGAPETSPQPLGPVARTRRPRQQRRDSARYRRAHGRLRPEERWRRNRFLVICPLTIYTPRRGWKVCPSSKRGRPCTRPGGCLRAHPVDSSLGTPPCYLALTVASPSGDR